MKYIILSILFVAIITIIAFTEWKLAKAFKDVTSDKWTQANKIL